MKILKITDLIIRFSLFKQANCECFSKTARCFIRCDIEDQRWHDWPMQCFDPIFVFINCKKLVHSDKLKLCLAINFVLIVKVCCLIWWRCWSWNCRTSREAVFFFLTSVSNVNRKCVQLWMYTHRFNKQHHNTMLKLNRETWRNSKDQKEAIENREVAFQQIYFINCVTQVLNKSDIWYIFKQLPLQNFIYQKNTLKRITNKNITVINKTKIPTELTPNSQKLQRWHEKTSNLQERMMTASLCVMQVPHRRSE